MSNSKILNVDLCVQLYLKLHCTWTVAWQLFASYVLGFGTELPDRWGLHGYPRRLPVSGTARWRAAELLPGRDSQVPVPDLLRGHAATPRPLGPQHGGPPPASLLRVQEGGSDPTPRPPGQCGCVAGRQLVLCLCMPPGGGGPVAGAGWDL